MADTDPRPSATVVEEKPTNGAAKTPTRPALKSGSSHANMNGPLYMQSGKNMVLVRRLKRKDQGIMKSLARWFIENQTGMSYNFRRWNVRPARPAEPNGVLRHME